MLDSRSLVPISQNIQFAGIDASGRLIDTWKVNFRLKTDSARRARIVIIAHELDYVNILAEIGVLRADQHCSPSSQCDIIVLPQTVRHETSMRGVGDAFAAFS